MSQNLVDKMFYGRTLVELIENTNITSKYFVFVFFFLFFKIMHKPLNSTFQESVLGQMSPFFC